MTITSSTADQLEALALQIFDAHVQPNDAAHAGLGAHFDPAFFTGIKGWDPAIDAQYLALIAPVMLAIDGNVMPTNYPYTANVTYALQGRPKHWFIEGLYEFVPGVVPPCSIGFTYNPLPGEDGHYGDHGSYGFTIGTATCAGICKLWAEITRMWLGGTYPRAVTQHP